MKKFIIKDKITQNKKNNPEETRHASVRIPSDILDQGIGGTLSVWFECPKS